MPHKITSFSQVWPRISPEPNSGCWLWTGCAQNKGYGLLKYEGETLAHRAVWRLLRGSPGDLQVLHACDNPTCVNPAHLFLGTHADNMADRNQKCRTNRPRGESNGRSKLTTEAIQDIRSRQLVAKEYAVKYGVAKSTITMIWIGKRWSDL